jgi:hypothetical protein
MSSAASWWADWAGAKHESSKSRAFARLPENARIVTALAQGSDEELRWKCQKLLAERSSTAPPSALAAPSAPALAMLLRVRYTPGVNYV